MNKPIVAIDVDGVLRNNLGIMVDLYNKKFNDTKTIVDVTDYDVELMFPRIKTETGTKASRWFFQNHSTEIFLNAKPFDCVTEDIKRLQEFADVIIITHQKSYENKMQTLKWLENNRIEPSGIVFIKNKTLLKCDYLIDDNDWNFIGTSAKYGVLIDAPYNRNKKIEDIEKQSHCPIYRFDSLHRFVDWFIENI